MSSAQSAREAWMDGLVESILAGEPHALMAHENIVFLDGGTQISAADGLEAVFKAMARVEAERDRYRELVRDVAGSGVSFDDERLGYIEVQIDRTAWDAIRAASDQFRSDTED